MDQRASDTLSLFRSCSEDAPQAARWVETVLRDHLSSGRPVPALGPGMSRRFEHPDQCVALVVETVAERVLAGARPEDIPVTLAFALSEARAVAETESVRAAVTAWRLAPGPLPVSWHASVVPGDEFRRETEQVRAEFRLAGLEGFIRFDRMDSRFPDCWSRAWGLSRRSADILRQVRAEAGGKGTGVFAAIDATLRAVNAEFLDRYDPEGVYGWGGDAKRNAHAAATHGTIAPGTYSVERMVDRSRPEAAPDGTYGVWLRRRPEAGPPHPVPFEPCIVYGEGGEPLPDLEAARTPTAARSI